MCVEFGVKLSLSQLFKNWKNKWKLTVISFRPRQSIQGRNHKKPASAGEVDGRITPLNNSSSTYWLMAFDLGWDNENILPLVGTWDEFYGAIIWMMWKPPTDLRIPAAEPNYSVQGGIESELFGENVSAEVLDSVVYMRNSTVEFDHHARRYVARDNITRATPR